MPIIKFIDYRTREEVAPRILDHIPRKGDKIFIEYSNLPPAKFYVYQVKWSLLPNQKEVVTIFLENAEDE